MRRDLLEFALKLKISKLYKRLEGIRSMGSAIKNKSTYDYIVIGSGYGGLLPAWRLAKAGAKILLIERGKRWNYTDFKQSWDPLYLTKVYDINFSDTLTEIFRSSRVLGGGSVMNSMMHQRTPSEAFDFTDPETGKRAWPTNVNRKTLNPFYDTAENLLGVRQLEIYEIPKIGANFGRFLKDAGLSCERGRFNIGRGCKRKGFCEAGCTSEEGKNTLIGKTLNEATATNNLSVIENLTALQIIPASGGYNVECVSSSDGNMNINLRKLPVTNIFHAPYVIVAAGPTGTVPLLMRSREHLPKLSPALGKWVSNNGDVNFIFELPKHYPPHDGYKSTNNAGMISYAFWDKHRVTMHPGFAPIGVMAGLDVMIPGERPWGLKHKHYVKEHVINRLIPVNAMRQVPSNLHMSVDDKGAAVIHNPPLSFRKSHGEYMLGLARQIADTAGGRVLLTSSTPALLDMGGQHIMGGARMSEDPATGVISPEGEVYGYKGLFVTDASAIPSTIGINPSITIGANALRIADGIVRGMT